MGEEACYWGETWKVCVVVFIFVSGYILLCGGGCVGDVLISQ